MPRQTEQLLVAPEAQAEGSAAVRARVEQSRRLQIARQGVPNGSLPGPELLARCRLREEARRLLAHALEKLGLSARGYHKILRVALTIADLAQADEIDEAHIAEAVSFRALDRRPASR